VARESNAAEATNRLWHLRVPGSYALAGAVEVTDGRLPGVNVVCQSSRFGHLGFVHEGRVLSLEHLSNATISTTGGAAPPAWFDRGALQRDRRAVYGIQYLACEKEAVSEGTKYHEWLTEHGDEMLIRACNVNGELWPCGDGLDRVVIVPASVGVEKYLPVVLALFGSFVSLLAVGFFRFAKGPALPPRAEWS
jgi:hypothetical protein